MPRHWGDETSSTDQERWDRGLRDTISEPGMTERDVQHRISLEESDRLEELGRIAYVDRPSDMERALHRDERKARADLQPRTGNVTVLPTVVRCACGARETGQRHPGHRYGCPRYAKNPTTEAA